MRRLCRIGQQKPALAINGHFSEGSGTPVPAWHTAPQGFSPALLGRF